MGQVISCTGSGALISAPLGVNDYDPTWTIGNLVTLRSQKSRVVGFVRSVETDTRNWSDDTAVLIAKVDLVGEVMDSDEGPRFSRGIRNYPHLGAESHQIRQRDLEAIYRVSSGCTAEVGKLTQDERIPAIIDVEAMLKRHFAIVGTTGVGKSTSVSIVVRKAVEARPDLRVVMVDPHNEFAAAFAGCSRVLDAKTFDLPFWMLRFEEFVEVIFRGREASENELDFLREAVENAKGAYLAEIKANVSTGSLLRRSFQSSGEAVSSDRPTPFRLTDIYAQIDEEMGKLESRYPRYDLKILKLRLREVADDPNFSFLFGKGSVDDTTEQVISKLFNLPTTGNRITVLQLGGIPSETVNAVVSVLARLCFDVAMLSSGQLETLIVCEEAHRYIPNDPKLGFAPTRRALAKIAKEGRKYGSYLAVVTQRPGELDSTILSQCSTVFAMRLTNELDQEIIRSAISDSSAGILAFLSSIGNREAIAFGEGVATPMRMRFVELNQQDRPSTAWLDRAVAKRVVDLREIVSRMRGSEPSSTVGNVQDSVPQQDANRMAMHGSISDRAVAEPPPPLAPSTSGKAARAPTDVQPAQPSVRGSDLRQAFNFRLR